ncbi:DUF624 domain-containing protein [Jingyaoa shaoxingensis]|uniref:DUF624 domain-containing protein n=1 Tax=Jingyaoa shaoxingensis TaxID=2763671 RepID=A0ABR7NC78_9FIRM|nr:DUF624 domain-containing protein [Jingyaoa shaoxingensis]MBC8573998.1 DUF624 domain-containing protein [Jingyaoa shaoxingensis]
MNQYFNQELPIFQFIYKTVLVILIGVLTFILCLFLIPAGPALTSLYDTIQKSVVQENGDIIKTYFRSFRNNFKDSFLAVAIMIGYAVIIGGGTYFSTVLSKQTGSLQLYRFIIGALFIPLFIIFPYIFPLISRFTFSIKEYFILSYYLSIKYFLNTILFCILIYGTILLIVMIPQALGIAFALPGIICFIISIKMEKILNDMEKKMVKE